MKSLFNRSSRVSSRVMSVALAGVLAFLLAASPLTAHAGKALGENANTPAQVVVQQTEDAQPQDTQASDAQAQTTSLTVYYCEMVPHDEPIDHPSHMRLIKSETFDGLTVGETFEPWDYVQDINGYWFFDGWSEDYVLSENPDENNLELHYFASQDNQATINYYIMSEGESTRSVDAASQALDSEHAVVNGEDVLFTKIGESQLDGLRFDRFVHGDDHAIELENLMLVDSYPSSIQVCTNPENNVINLLYAPSLTSLPDDMPADDEEAVEPPADSTPGDDADTSTPDNTPDADKPADTPSDTEGDTDGEGAGADDSTGDNTGNNTGEGTDAQPDGADKNTNSVIEDNETPLAGNSADQDSADATVKPDAAAMPQTGDPLEVFIMSVIFVASSAATVLLVIRRRNARNNA